MHVEDLRVRAGHRHGRRRHVVGVVEGRLEEADVAGRELERLLLALGLVVRLEADALLYERLALHDRPGRVSRLEDHRQVAAVHGERHPELVRLRGVFTRFKAELLNHMQKEELVVFPLCRRLESGGVDGPLAGPGLQRPVEYPVY